jgi:hypothetical protein
MNVWKWSIGEPYYKSARPEKTSLEKSSNYEYDSQINAINQSLADEPFLNQELNLSNGNHSFSSGTRREDIDTKMADREMLAQRGVNPFLQTSYVNDIVTRDMYLKPINTTQGRVKNVSKED